MNIQKRMNPRIRNKQLDRKSIHKEYSYISQELREYLRLHDLYTKLWYRAVYAQDTTAQRVYHTEAMIHEPAIVQAVTDGVLEA